TKLKLIPLLFQTGYLTIKNVEDNIIYTLGYPNYEVERGLTQNLLEEFTDDRVETPIIHRIKKSLLNSEYEQFMEYMKSLFAGIANINIPKSLEEREHYYHSIFYLTGMLFSDNHLNVYSELLTSEGRIDMLVETEKSIFIIEFKCNQSTEKAVEQIKEKNYADKFKIKGKEINRVPGTTRILSENLFFQKNKKTLLNNKEGFLFDKLLLMKYNKSEVIMSFIYREMI
ncbi:MAG: PD-(D/E)XK nuclease domain-containing protein, partial [bacterium]